MIWLVDLSLHQPVFYRFSIGAIHLGVLQSLQNLQKKLLLKAEKDA